MMAADRTVPAVGRTGDSVPDARGPAPSTVDGRYTDVLLVALVATAPVLLEWAAGYVRGGSDLGRLFQPLWAWWFERPRLLDGWNPWVFGGFGSGSDPQLAALHPFGLLYAALSSTTASAVEGALAPAVAGTGMLLYSRRIGCGRTARLLGALSFALGGFLTGHAPHPVIQRSAMMVPWGLLALEVLDGRALAVALAGVVGLILLSGHPQVSVLAIALLVLDAAWLGRPWERHRWWWILIGLALGASIGAPLWLPGAELVATTTRALGGPIYPDPTFTAAELPSLLVPLVGGGGIGPLASPVTNAFACGVIECAAYPGWLPWVLAIAGAAAVVRSRHGRFWLAIAIVALVAAGGVLPLPTGVRGAARFLLWWNVAFAVVAAIAAEHALRAPARPLLVSGVLAIVTLVIAAPASAGAIAGAATAVAAASAALIAVRRGARPERWVTLAVAVDLLLFAGTVAPGASRPEELARLREPIAELRVRLDGAPCGVAPDARALLLGDVPSNNWVQPLHVATVQGYNPLVPASVAALLGQTRFGLEAVGAVDDATLADGANRALDLLRVGVVLHDRRVPSALGDAIASAARAGDPRWESRPACAPEGFEAFLNRRVAPVAWLVEDADVATPRDAIARVRGASGGLDPARTVLLETDAARPASAPARAGSGGGTVDVAERADDALTVRTDAPRDAFLVTSERAAPGWTATVDGADAPLLLANGAFRAVRVPAGAHEVRFAYRPWRTRAGLALAAAGCLAALLLARASVAARRAGR